MCADRRITSTQEDKSKTSHVARVCAISSKQTPFSEFCLCLMRANSRNNSSILDSLCKLRTVIDGSFEPHRGIYLNTWQLLQDGVERWPLNCPRGGITTWPINITEAYFCLLKSGDWIARILFLHYSVSMHLLSDRWFAVENGRRLVSSFLQRLDGYPPAWADTIAWARRAVEIDK